MSSTHPDATPSTQEEHVACASQALPRPIAAALAERFQVDPFEPTGAEAAGSRILLTDAGVGATAAMMDRLPRLELIACYGVGVDAIDLSEARARGIRVTNTPGLLTDAVADLALALVLASARHVVASDRYIREGAWTRLVADVPLGRGLRGRTLGIVGLGSIGSAIAERAAAFGVDLAYTGPRRKDAAPYRFEPDLLELARQSAFLVLACRGGDETRGIVNGDVLEALGPEGTLVNVARGSVVDESALVAALTSGKLGFAALDVFAEEPAVPVQLLSLPNVIMTPHQGSATLATRIAMGELLIDNISAFVEGRPLPTPVAQS